MVGELDRVVADVEQDLAQARGVAEQCGRQQRRLDEQELDALVVGAHAHEIAEIFEHVAEREPDDLDVELAGLDLGEVEDVVDDAEQRLGRPVDLLHVVQLLRVEVALQGQVGHAENGVHRRADLVAHVGQEVALGVVGGVGLVLGDDQFGGPLPDHVLEVLAVALKFVVGALLVGDVARDAEKESGLAACVEDRDLLRVHDAHAATRVDGLFRDVDHLPGLQHRAVLQREEVGFLRREQIMDRATDELVASGAQQFLARLVEAHEAQRGGVLDEDHVRNVLDDAVQELLAGARGLLGPLAFGDLVRLPCQGVAQFRCALVDAYLQLGIELLQRSLGLLALPAVFEELLDRTRHVRNLVGAAHRHLGVGDVGAAMPERAADEAQARHDMASEECLRDQPGQQQARADFAGDPPARPVGDLGQALDGVAVVAGEIVGLLACRDTEGVGLPAQVVVERGQGEPGRRRRGNRQGALAHLGLDVDRVAKVLARPEQRQDLDIAFRRRGGQPIHHVVEGLELLDDLPMRVAHRVDRLQ